MIAQAAPMGQNRRISSDSCWPLRDEQGRTFAERKAAQSTSSDAPDTARTRATRPWP